MQPQSDRLTYETYTSRSLLMSITTPETAWRLFAETEFLVKAFSDFETLVIYVDCANGMKERGEPLTGDSMARVLACVEAAGSVERLAAQATKIWRFYKNGEHLYDAAQSFQRSMAEYFASVYAISGIRFILAHCSTCKCWNTVPHDRPRCPDCDQPLTTDVGANP